MTFQMTTTISEPRWKAKGIAKICIQCLVQSKVPIWWCERPWDWLLSEFSIWQTNQCHYYYQTWVRYYATSANRSAWKCLLMAYCNWYIVEIILLTRRMLVQQHFVLSPINTQPRAQLLEHNRCPVNICWFNDKWPRSLASV